MRPLSERASETVRLKMVIRGAVQGVGFRPFVFRLATEMGLAGWVNNSAEGVFIEVEGAKARLDEFLSKLELEKPPRSFIQSLESSWLDALGYVEFEIRESHAGGPKSALILPDIATCPDCLAEIFDPKNRRYLYPFTNCTHCGPRFSIIEALPYDRANTSMKGFRMCAQCQVEYENPEDRRFHAQPNACAACGPQLELWDSEGAVLSRPEGAGKGKRGPLGAAAEAIRAGSIVAVKGLGGFHLMAAAGDVQAVNKLRERKHREEKPLALLFPSLDAVREVCEVSGAEARLLLSAEAPIVLLRRLSDPRNSAVAPGVAPGNPNLGVMLPYAPVHHLLLALLKSPAVATSGNLSDEPICIDEHEALERLKGIADLFLVHNRPIVRHVDDSIVRVMADRELVLRRARGYAPLPIRMRNAECGMRNPDPVRSAECGMWNGVAAIEPVDVAQQQVSESTSPLRTPHSAFRTLLGVGAHLKNAIALAIGPEVFISQHIGDLETAQAFDAFRRVIADLQRLYDSPAVHIAADAHPDYLSTRFAQESGLARTTVQHHVAHVLSCMAENELEPPALGVSWDGTGYGLDGTVWGGEFFRIHATGYERVAHSRQFRLPGSERAIREPRRSALGLMFGALGDAVFDRSDLAPLAAFSSSELAGLRTMLVRDLNSPRTSSVGRLFDSAASLMGLRQRVGFEGQAAMELEFLAGASSEPAAYPVGLQAGTPTILDWQPAIEALLMDLKKETRRETISARFHNMLADSVVQVARRIGLERVVLSGGCFQNRYLTERTIQRLRAEGLRPYWHQRIPPNDGGICLGQVVAARWWNV